MNLLNKTLSQISCHKYLRCDYKYWQTQKLYAFTDFSYLKDMFEIINGSVQTKSYSTEKTSIPYIRIGDISYKFGINDDNLLYLCDDAEISERRLLKKDDLVLATIGTVGKIGLADEYIGGTHSNNTVILRKRTAKLNAAFYEKLFQSDLYIKYIFGLVSQKAQPNLQQYDLEYIKIPNISDGTIKSSMTSIASLVEKIKPLQSVLVSTQVIIDAVLKREFNFNYEKFEDLKKNTRFCSSMGAFANNPDLRFSAKFHRHAGEYVQQELNRITTKKIKHYLAEPIILGASITPEDFDETGEVYYVSMASIKNLTVEYDDSQLVSSSYQNNNSKKMLRKGDIVMARSGVAIGKTALVTEDFDSIFADFTMRIRLKDYNPLFAYYYIRSTYFQYLIEIYKKGLQNQNIFPIVVREFPLPDISLEEQQRIVDEIQAEIDKQNEIKSQIASLREGIDKIIEDVICDLK